MTDQRPMPTFAEFAQRIVVEYYAWLSDHGYPDVEPAPKLEPLEQGDLKVLACALAVAVQGADRESQIGSNYSVEDVLPPDFVPDVYENTIVDIFMHKGARNLYD